MKTGNLIAIIILFAIIGLIAYRIYRYKMSPLNPKNWFRKKNRNSLINQKY